VPYIGPTGFATTDNAKWNALPTTNPPYLEFDPVTDGQGGKQYIPPQRQPGPEFPAALQQERMGAIEGMKAQMGIYDASLGARSNEVSGIAIEQRQSQGDISTYHFTDNMVRAIRYAGLVLNERMPLVYDKERVVRILKPDGTAAMVAINQEFVTDPETYQNVPGLRIDTGRYDVVVKAGPSYATQRQETQQMLWQMVKAYPPLMQLAGDLLFKAMDFNGADEIAKRLAPQGSPQVPPQLAQQIQQMQEALAQGKGIIGDLQQKVNALELDGKRKDVEAASLRLQLRDKSQANAIDAQGNMIEHMQRIRDDQKYIIDTLLKFKELALKAAQPVGGVVQEAQATEPQVERLVQ
jgi:hypothetical protein